VVGKFFGAYPPASSSDRGLLREYDNYRWAARLGLSAGGPGPGPLPRLLGRRPEVRLGLLLEDIPGPDLDRLLLRAALHGEADLLNQPLEKLAALLARFHTRPLPGGPVSPGPALRYLAKVTGQLEAQGLVNAGDRQALAAEGRLWELRLGRFADGQVLVHGDATPTNFLFPDGRCVAVDLERLRLDDRLWDLSYLAGELKHAWGWRTGHPEASEAAIRHFFTAYLAALPAAPGLADRLFALNPFYMALAELRIARNDYLSRDYRLALIAEARRCLTYGRRTP
jgi:Ser/Thr protein kinase RdoA (MazF antagonist)